MRERQVIAREATAGVARWKRVEEGRSNQWRERAEYGEIKSKARLATCEISEPRERHDLDEGRGDGGDDGRLKRRESLRQSGISN